VDLAGDAVDREAVRAVGCDLELDHVAAERQHVAQRRARDRAVVEHEDALMLAAQGDLVGCEDHALAQHAPQPRRAERTTVGQHRAGARHGDRLPGRHIGRATDDRCRLRLADLHLADAQAIGIGMAERLEHAADDVVIAGRRAVAEPPFGLRTGQRQPRGELLGGERRVAVLTQPFERDEHQ
jgi:hypothetical protein